eukprot:scaffold15564_cov127-Skeletonema_marinoi.AAC.1
MSRRRKAKDRPLLQAADYSNKFCVKIWSSDVMIGLIDIDEQNIDNKQQRPWNREIIITMRHTLSMSIWSTSSAKNANILQRLRDGDRALDSIVLSRVERIHLCRSLGFGLEFVIREDDNLGWLGYFIGKSDCLKQFRIDYLPEGEQQIHAFLGGIARSQCIRNIGVSSLSNDRFTSIIRVLRNQSQLEGLTIDESHDVGPDAWNNYFGNEGLNILLNGLRGIGSSLETLRLYHNSIGNEGLLAVLTPVTLDYLELRYCCINNEGLQELAKGISYQCKGLDLDGNHSISSSGLTYLATALQSESCCLENLYLFGMLVGDDSVEALAAGLKGNQSLTCLHLLNPDSIDVSVTAAGWFALSAALCDTSSIKNTYDSNHILHDFWSEFWNGNDHIIANNDEDVVVYLRLNEEHPQYTARCKILMTHPHLHMQPLLQWGLKFLPLAVAWFERAKPCTALTIFDCDPDLRRRVLEESDEAFESRKLTTMYEFVRGMPMEVMKRRKKLIESVCDDNGEIARIDERYRHALEQRDKEIEQLQEEIRRLKGL